MNLYLQKGHLTCVFTLYIKCGYNYMYNYYHKFKLKVGLNYPMLKNTKYLNQNIKVEKIKHQTTFLITIAAILIIASVQYAQAEPTQIIQGSIDGTSVSIMHDGITNIIILEKDGITSEHYDGIIKTYNSGGFVIKNIESGIVVFGHPIGNEQYRLVVITNYNVYRLIGVSQIIEAFDAVTPSGEEPVNSVGADITYWNIPSTLTRTDPTGVGKPLQITVKADEVHSFFINEKYEPNISVINYWNHNEGIQDATVYLEISRDGVIIGELESVTSSAGQWNPSVEIPYPKFYPNFCYDVKITATSGNQTATLNDDFLVLTTAKYYSSTEEYGIDPSTINSDFECNDDAQWYSPVNSG